MTIHFSKMYLQDIGKALAMVPLLEVAAFEEPDDDETLPVTGLVMFETEDKAGFCLCANAYAAA